MTLLRPYAASDLPAVLTVWEAASRVGHPFLSEDDLARGARLVAYVYLPAAETWAAVENAPGGAVLGFIGLLKGAFVGGLFVDPAHHGRGIGRALIAHARTLHGPLSVGVYEANTGGHAFYLACGFTLRERRPLDDDGRPWPLLMMAQER